MQRLRGDGALNLQTRTGGDAPTIAPAECVTSVLQSHDPIQRLKQLHADVACAHGNGHVCGGGGVAARD